MALPAPATPDPSARHLAGRLALVESSVRAAVAHRRRDDPDPEDRFRGLYVSDAQADALLRPEKPSGPLVARAVPLDAGAAGRLEAVEAEADEAEAVGADLRLRRLARAFELSPLDVELLLVALAPDLDPRFERLYGYLNDDVTRRRASVGLALALCGVAAASGSGRSRLTAGRPLLAGGLLEVEEPDHPFLSRLLRVPDRVAAHLLADDAPEPALAPLLLDPPPSDATAGSLLARGLRAGARLAYLREGTGSDARGLAVAAFAELGLPAPVVLDLAALEPAGDARPVAGVAVREARLRGGGLVAGPIDPLAQHAPGTVRLLADVACRVVLHGARAWDPAWSRDVALLLEAPPAPSEARARAWRLALAAGAAREVAAGAGGPAGPPARGPAARGPEASTGSASPGLEPSAGPGRPPGPYRPESADPAVLAYRLSAPQIVRAAAAARLRAAAAGRRPEATDIGAGVRAQNAAGLERLARRIEPRASWADLVLPAAVLEQLRDLAARARNRELVLDTWGLGGASSRGRGLTALLAGDSGTGKTLSAEVVAGDLGLDLYVVDLATVVDKYVGETEKNLDRIFSQADGVNGVLLFDEAEALFGKRSEVRDAHDRYANVEVAYLLHGWSASTGRRS